MASKKGVDLSFSISESEALGSIRNLTSQILTMNKELNLTNTVLKSDNASVDDYKNKLDILSKEKETLSNKVKIANDVLEKAKATYGENSKEVQKWQNNLLDAQIAQQKCENQIQDTTKTINEYGKETEEASKKTSIFGDVLKANLASDLILSSAKALVNVVKSIGNGIKNVVSDSISAYADYEQLIGGVETLFKDSAGIVAKNAQEAYKTAGVSSNKYMEQATSFSATLLQGLKGNTTKAAEYADIAIRDMSDNANKMGTDVSMIQNAYQGFAKDNYTMLDNLKLGYGGTAGEMARLVNDSGVMGGSFKATAENVKDIPFDKLIEALHQTQEEMGITGTTSLEASETITGSLNSVKSSWENVLSSLASGNDEQLKGAIDGIVESVGNLSNNVIEILPNILNGIGQLIQNVISKMPEMITKILPTLSNTLKGFVSTILTVIPELIPVVIDIMKEIVNTIIDNLPMILEVGIVLLLEIINGISESIPELIPVIINVVLKIIDILANNADKIIIAGFDILIALTVGIIKAIPDLLSAIPKVISSLLKAFGNLLSGFWEVGKNIVSGIWAGISESFTWIKNKISNWVGDVLSFIKKLFGIKSPSRLMKEEVGLNLGLGVAEGITDSISAVNDAMNSLQNSAVGNIQPNLNIGDATMDGVELGVGRPIVINIDKFENNREQDVEAFAEEFARFMEQKKVA